MMIPLAKQPAAGAITPPGALLHTVVLSVLLSAALLLFRQYGWAQPLPGVALPLSLALAFACGVALGRYRPLTQRQPLVVARYGLTIAAAGLLWILLALHAGLAWTLLLLGGGLAGVSLGAVYQSNRRIAPPGQLSPGVSIAMAFACSAALAATQWLQWQAVPAGVNFALALLVDIALFGALLARIAERDRESDG